MELVKKSPLLVTCGCLFLLSCGGGGSSENNSQATQSPTPPTTINPNAIFTLDSNSVSFSFELGERQYQLPLSVNGDVVGAEQDIFIEIEMTDLGVVDISRTELSGRRLDIFPGDTSHFGFGVHSDEITIRVCNDASCTSHVNGSPQTIAVSVELLEPHFEVEQRTISLDYTFGSEYLESSLITRHSQGLGSIITGESQLKFTDTFEVPELLDVTIIDDRTASKAYRVSVGNDAKIDNAIAAGTLSPGVNSGVIKAETQFGSIIIEDDVSVEIYIPEKQLILSKRSIALSHHDNVEKLTQSIDVMELHGDNAFTWSASSADSWLSVTSSGASADKLIISANPEGLEKNQLHYSTITVYESELSIKNVEHINVAFWVGDGDAPSKTIIEAPLNKAEFDNMRPHVYTFDPDSANILVFNMYTGELVNTIDFLASQGEDASRDGRVLNISSSSDATKLYVLYSNCCTSYKQFEVDLTDASFTTKLFAHRAGGSYFPTNYEEDLQRFGNDDFQYHIYAPKNNEDISTSTTNINNNDDTLYLINELGRYFCTYNEFTNVIARCGTVSYSPFSKRFKTEFTQVLSDSYKGTISPVHPVVYMGGSDGKVYEFDILSGLFSEKAQIIDAEKFNYFNYGEFTFDSDGTVYALLSPFANEEGGNIAFFRYDDNRGMSQQSVNIPISSVNMSPNNGDTNDDYQLSSDGQMFVINNIDDTFTLFINPFE